MSDTIASPLHRGTCFLFGLLVYLLFLGTFLYAIGFVGNIVVPKSIDSGTAGPVPQSIVINVLLLGLFAVQHTIMARPGFKKRWTQIVPAPIERATFVLATCLILILTYWQWRPLPTMVWSVQVPALRILLHVLCAAGFGLVLCATFLIDHFDLFGLRQVTLHLRGVSYSHPGFAMPFLYKMIRNPLMLGFLVAFWSTPDMSQGRLLFAVTTTAYILIGIRFEERDLLKILGEDYRRYRERTPMLLPWPKRARKVETVARSS